MADDLTLAEYGLTSKVAKAESPAELGLVFLVDGEWEDLQKTPYSSPPPLPEIMKAGADADDDDNDRDRMLG